MGLGNLVSIRSLSEGLGKVLRRFPVSALFAVCATVSAIALIEENSADMVKEGLWLRLLFASYLGMVLSISVSLLLEGFHGSTLRVVSHAGVFLMSVSIFYFFQPLMRHTDVFRFAVIAVAAHLLVPYSTYWPARSSERFWYFNQVLFLRFFTAVLYAAVLFLGLAAAISSVRYLFGLDLHANFYLNLWVVIVGIFQTFFFLAGVPETAQIVDQQPSPGLRKFTGFVLIPLAIIYAAILISYEVKILIDWTLPKGLVATLILGYSIFGLLAILLIYPSRLSGEYPWIRIFVKGFFLLMIPMLALLFTAIVVRIREYGLTEERVIVFFVGVWLSILSIYFLIKGAHNIVVVPVSLTLIALFMALGPVNLTTLSRESQISQLRKLAGAEGSGKTITPIDESLPRAAAYRMVNVVDYLINRHGLTAVAGQIDKQVPSPLLMPSTKLSSWEYRDQQREWLYAYLKIDPETVVQSTRHPGSLVNVEADNPDVLSLGSHEYIVRFTTGQDTVKVNIHGSTLTMIEDKSAGSIVFAFNGVRRNVSTSSLLSGIKIDEGGDFRSGALKIPRSKLSQRTDVAGLAIQINWNRLTLQDGRMIYGEAFILLKP